MRLLLASASPRRADLLRAAGLTFDTAVADVDETRQPGEAPADYATRVAHAKAEAVHRLHPEATVIGADTIVVVDGDVLGKPAEAADAARMLRRLSGRAHEVLTGVSIIGPHGARRFVDGARVWFRPLSEDDIAWYVATGEPMDKAGAYAVQGGASRFVSRIEGTCATVVGLPICRLCEVLSELGELPVASETA